MTARPPAAPRRPGFALVLSLTIMSLLVLVVLSLAGFLAIESRLADQSLRAALARHNAVMSLRLALAQLQLLAGPDQRVTATADLLDPAAAGLAAPTNPNYARFTGVWHAGPKLDSKTRRLAPVQRSDNGYLYDTRFTEDGASQPSAGVHADGTPYDWSRDRERTAPDSRLLGWLVSGNEGRPLGDPAYLGPRSAWSTGAANNRIPLVGPGTLGSAARLEGSLSAPTGRVELPSVIFPGAQGDLVSGRYAWWVGDEGVKARVNLPDPRAAFQPSTANPEEGGYYRLMTSQRANFTLVKDPVGGTFAPFATWDTASAATLAAATGFGDLSTALANPGYDYRVLFHDLTFHSLGLHTDTSRGGLKRDLTPYLQLPASSTGIPGVNWVGVAPAGARAQALPGILDDEAILEGAQFAGTGPKHGLIRSWFRQARPFDDAAAISLADARRSEPSAGTTDNQNYLVPRMSSQRTTPVHPLLAQVNAFFRPAYDSADGNAYMLVYPRVVLWNPWNVPLAAAPYVVDIGQRFAIRATVNYSGTSSGLMILRFGNGAVPVSTVQGHPNTGSYVRLTDLVFTVPATNFQPGEALVFTAPSGPAPVLARGVSRPQAAGIHPLAPAPLSDLPYFKAPITGLPEPFLSMSRSGGVTGTSVTYGGSNGYDWSIQHAVSFAGASYAYSNAPGQTYLLDGTGVNALQMIDSDAYQRGNLGRWVGLSNDAAGLDFPDLAGGSPAITPHRIASVNHRLIWHDEPGLPGGPPDASGVGAYGNHNRQFNLFVQHNPRSARFIRSPWDLAFRRRANHDRMFGIYTTERDPLAFGDSQLAPVFATGRARAAPFFSSTQASPAHVYTLYDLPHPALGVLSLGQLQHAAFAHFPWHPSLALGNGFADPSSPDVASSQALSVQVGYFSSNFPNLPGLAHQRDDVPASSYYNYDLAYELNAAMWDAYLVSGIPADDNGWTAADAPWSRVADWPNARIVQLGSKALPSGVAPAVPTAYFAPASTAVAGAFNVNSTSVPAWVALLSSARNLRVPTALAGSDSTGTPFPRNLRPQHGKVQGSVANPSFNKEVWGGYRSLTDAEVELLATQIVAEVRRRGPFLSLADFVSRRLEPVDPATAPYEHPGNLGTLQAAIERAGLNQAFGTPVSSASGTYEGDFNRLQRSPVADYADGEDNLRLRPRAAARVAHRAAGAPGHLLQSDILQQLAPALTARSDTFVVRFYGQATDGSGARSLAEAWGEAVVQRMPEPVLRENDSAPAGLNPEQPSPGVARKVDLGRRFRVVSFRWLSRNEL
jgi:hypothetical protein